MNHQNQQKCIDCHHYVQTESDVDGVPYITDSCCAKMTDIEPFDMPSPEWCPIKTKAEMMAVIDQLRDYNRWRRGADTPQPSPKDLGVSIDKAIDIIESIYCAMDY